LLPRRPSRIFSARSALVETEMNIEASIFSPGHLPSFRFLRVSRCHFLPCDRSLSNHAGCDFPPLFWSHKWQVLELSCFSFIILRRRISPPVAPFSEPSRPPNPRNFSLKERISLILPLPCVDFLSLLPDFSFLHLNIDVL